MRVSQLAALGLSQSASLQGRGRRMSLTERTGVWPKTDACWASIKNAKKAVRREDSSSAH